MWGKCDRLEAPQFWKCVPLRQQTLHCRGQRKDNWDKEPFHTTRNLLYNIIAITILMSDFWNCTRADLLTILSVESQKGFIAFERCSLENQKGAITNDFVQRSALLVLNGTSIWSFCADHWMQSWLWWDCSNVQKSLCADLLPQSWF